MSCCGTISATYKYIIFLLVCFLFPLMALAKISSTVLRQSRGNEWTLSQSDFRKHTFSYSPVSKTMAISLSYIVFMVLSFVHSNPGF